MQWYMRNQLLRDADWAGMAHSVEIRVPFVDVPLFRALAPWLAGGREPSKTDAISVLRTALPQEIARRPKTGFSIPVAAWTANAGPESMSRGLRAWAQRVLSQPSLQRFHAE
jgi:asparagine synthase (glutamine-hydrolysing)